MKKILIVLSVFLVISLFASSAKADVIFEGTHPIDKCVKIINSLDFPQYYVVGYLRGPMVTIPNYIVQSNECLTKGYKFTSLSLYLADRKYIDSIGIENFNPSATNYGNNFYILSDQIEPSGGYVADNNALQAEYVEYNLVKSAGDKFELQKTKDTPLYNSFPYVDFFKALLLTLIVELPILFIFLRKRVEYKKILSVGVLTNIFSLFILWYVLKRYLPTNNYLLIGEGIVVVLEAIIYKIFFKVSVINVLLISFVANLCSWYIGYIFFRMLFM